MGRFEKLLKKFYSHPVPVDISYQEAARLLLAIGCTMRKRSGRHRVFTYPGHAQSIVLMENENLRQYQADALEGESDRFLDTPANHSELIHRSEKYKSVKYPVVLTELVGGEWLAEHKDLPGCKIHGTTSEEAMTKLEEVKLSWIYAALAEGREIPKPIPGVPIVKIV